MATTLTISGPEFGVSGIPDGEKEAGQRVDLKDSKFELMIETKGNRLAWQRGAMCPCEPVNDQTEQNDPNCTVCQGNGFYYFGPLNYTQPANMGSFTDTQQLVIDRGDLALVRGYISGIRNRPDAFTFPPGLWQDGTSMVTVRAANKLGYFDRLIDLDGEIVHSEILDSTGEGELALRYPCTGMNLISSLTTRYSPDEDFTVEQGKVQWVTGRAPAAGTRLVAHYLTYPHWVVIEHPHATRMTLSKYKRKTTITPQGDPVQLPVQALIRLEWLPLPE